VYVVNANQRRFEHITGELTAEKKVPMATRNGQQRLRRLQEAENQKRIRLNRLVVQIPELQEYAQMLNIAYYY